jgi:putative heme transporter
VTRASPARRRALRIGFTLASLFLGVHLLLPLAGGFEATAEALARATWWLAWVLLVLEAGSFWAYGELLLVVLRGPGERAPRNLIQRSTVVGASLGKTMPGGSVTAMAITATTLRAQGMSGARVTAGLAVAGVVSWAVLGLLLPVGAVLALIGGQAGAIALGAVALAAAAVVAGAFVPVALRRPERAGGLVERVIGSIARGRIRRWVEPAKIGSLVSTGIAGAAELVGNRRALAAGGAWAIANWLLDFGVFVTLAAAIGGETPLLPLLLIYVIGQLLAAIPITPGGVGIVEATMTGMLVAAGAPAGEATAAVLGWRLVSHWLPIVVGLLFFPTLVVSRRRAVGAGETQS